MKHQGSRPDFTDLRNRELMLTFRRVLAERRYFNVREDFRLVVDQPCSRFWVSEERAAAVVSAMLRGRPVLAGMRHSKQEMYREIHRRVLAMRASDPSAPLFDLVFAVVGSPAPRFYLSPKYAADIIYRILRENRSDHSGRSD